MLRFAMVFCCLALVACGKPKYPACENDDHCKDKNEFCVNKQCQQCRNDKDCKDGKVCKAGRCEAKSSGCTDDTQCPTGQSCIDGACKACVTGRGQAPNEPWLRKTRSGSSSNSLRNACPFCGVQPASNWRALRPLNGA